jgi:hypothetical protein
MAKATKIVPNDKGVDEVINPKHYKVKGKEGAKNEPDMSKTEGDKEHPNLAEPTGDDRDALLGNK